MCLSNSFQTLVQFVPLEEMLTEFDDNGDGVISLDEFVAHLNAAPALWQAIHNNIDPGTGKLKGYVSLEQQLAELEAKAAPLDAKQVSDLRLARSVNGEKEKER